MTLKDLREATGVSIVRAADIVNMNESSYAEYEVTPIVLTPYIINKFIKHGDVKRHLVLKNLGITEIELANNYGIDYKEFPGNLGLVILGQFEYINLIPISLIQQLDELDPREKSVLIARFRDRLTLAKTGELLGVGPERIRQIEAKAIRKLKSPKRIKRINYNTIKKLEEELGSVESYFNGIKSKLEKQERIINQLRKELENANIKTKDIGYDDAFYIPIENLDLSVRTYHSLLRANIRTVGDIAEKNLTQLSRIRNLGRKSLTEVLDTVHRFGIRIDGE